MEGNKIFLPFIYGSTAKQLDHPTAQEHTHKWKIHVRGISNSDLSPFIRKVTFKLHESFNNPLRTIDSFPFEIQETGWGEFEIQIRIYFHEPHDKSLSFSHFLRLYPSSDTFSNGDEQDPISSPISSKMVICEKYDEIVSWIHLPFNLFDRHLYSQVRI